MQYSFDSTDIFVSTCAPLGFIPSNELKQHRRVNLVLGFCSLGAARQLGLLLVEQKMERFTHGGNTSRFFSCCLTFFACSCALSPLHLMVVPSGCMVPTSRHTIPSRGMQIVIAASILFFRTAASLTNIAGTSVALSGVLLYSLAKRTIKTEPDLDAVRMSCMLVGCPNISDHCLDHMSPKHALLSGFASSELSITASVATDRCLARIDALLDVGLQCRCHTQMPLSHLAGLKVYYMSEGCSCA
jgi:hypothetical protein